MQTPTQLPAKDTTGVTVTANSSDSGNGGSGVDGSYQINVGLDTEVGGTGWGAGTWGRSTWGSGADISATTELRLWSHDNFGEDFTNKPKRWRYLLLGCFAQMLSLHEQ